MQKKNEKKSIALLNDRPTRCQKNATKEKKLEYFKDNEMRSANVWVDMLWLTLAAKMLNTNLRIYSLRWKTTGPSTKRIDPIKPIDVCDVPLSSIENSPTLKVIRVTSSASRSKL